MGIKITLTKLCFSETEKELIADALRHFSRYCLYKREVPREYSNVDNHIDLAHLCVNLLNKIK